MVLVAAAWGADREGGLRLGIWAEVESERGGSGGRKVAFQGVLGGHDDGRTA